MTQRRKRQRTKYHMHKWWRPVHNFVPGGSSATPSQCHVAVVRGDVISHQVRGNKLVQSVKQQTPVQGWWLPATFVIDTPRAQFVVDVDLVPHTTPRKLQRQHQRIRDVGAAGHALPDACAVVWSVLWITTTSDVDGYHRVLAARHVTDRYAQHITQVVVRPPHQRAGARGQRAVAGKTLPLVPSDLLNVALDAAAFHASLYPAARRGDVAKFYTSKAAPRVSSKGRRLRTRTERTDEVLQLVRNVWHDAAPDRRVQAVADHFGWSKRNASQWIRKSQLQLRWGLAYARSRQSHNTQTKGSKT
jgi:hypothetical protein